MVQALNALLFPMSVPDESAAQATQFTFVASGCITALLDAVKEANKSDSGEPSSVWCCIAPLKCSLFTE